MHGVVYVGTSFDGFVADANGGIDWLESTPGPDHEDFGFSGLVVSVDAMVMGRTTFEVARGAPTWPYGDVPVTVLTHRELDLRPDLEPHVEAFAGSADEVAARMDERGHDRVYVDGGDVVHQFLRARLVHEVTVTRLPVVLGAGIPLFGPAGAGIRLLPRRVTAYPEGWVQHVMDVSYPQL